MAKKVSKAEFRHAMSRRMVDVSQTSFDTGAKRVRGPKGKLFTGAVDLGGGKTATYERGRRLKVDSSKKGFAGAPRGRSGGGGASGVTGGGASGVTGGGASVGSRISGSDAIARALSNKAPVMGGRAGAPTSGMSRLEGPRRSMPVAGSAVKSKLAGTVQKERARTAAVRGTSGFVRGVVGSSTVMNRPKGTSLQGTLARKRAEDTRNQVRNAIAVASIPVIAAGAVGGSSAAIVGTALRVGTPMIRAQQAAARASQVRAAAQAAAKSPASPAKTPQQYVKESVKTMKDMAKRQSAAKKTSTPKATSKKPAPAPKPAVKKTTTPKKPAPAPKKPAPKKPAPAPKKPAPAKKTTAPKKTTKRTSAPAKKTQRKRP